MNVLSPVGILKTTNVRQPTIFLSIFAQKIFDDDETISIKSSLVGAGEDFDNCGINLLNASTNSSSTVSTIFISISIFCLLIIQSEKASEVWKWLIIWFDNVVLINESISFVICEHLCYIDNAFNTFN